MSQYEQRVTHQLRTEKIKKVFKIMLTVFLCFPDVYYYLKDPPPEFLPRFGTITMAGLLGMFMARKGNLIPVTISQTL